MLIQCDADPESVLMNQCLQIFFKRLFGHRLSCHRLGQNAQCADDPDVIQSQQGSQSFVITQDAVRLFRSIRSE